MSNEISEVAWKRAASMETFHFGDIDESGGRNARVVFADDIASQSFYIPRLCAEEAQAELDAADEVTDAEIEAIARMCELEYPELFAMAWDMGLFARRILTAARKARQA